MIHRKSLPTSYSLYSSGQLISVQVETLMMISIISPCPSSIANKYTIKSYMSLSSSQTKITHSKTRSKIRSMLRNFKIRIESSQPCRKPSARCAEP